MQATAELPLRSPRASRTKGDEEIWRGFSQYIFLTVEQAATLLNRDESTIQKRFNKFFKIRYLNRERESDFHPYVYFLAREGGNICYEKGFTNSPWFIGEKSPSHLPHDVLISEFHLKLHQALTGHRLVWEQWRGDMDDMKPTIPDARFAIDDDDEFAPLENVRSRPKHDKNGSTLVQKLHAYETLKIKRVYFLLPTEERRKQFLENIEAEFGKSTVFWFTTYDLALGDPLGKIWQTPKNFRDRQYSILRPES